MDHIIADMRERATPLIRHVDISDDRSGTSGRANGGHANRDWTPPAPIVERMGKESDESLGRECGVSASVIAAARKRLGINAFVDAGVWRWTPEMDRQLGKRDDGELAKLWGMSAEAVRRRRTKLGIAPTRAKGKWTAERLEILRSTSDNGDAATKLGISIAAVKTARSRFK